ncbi:hypothetical protein RQP46_009754 [Phenoliferia psychrophenolica]
MTSSGRHEISLREGLGAFRKLPWVQVAVADALATAYQIGTKYPNYTTHAVRLHFAFNFNKTHLADQFTLVSGTLLPHVTMATSLTTFTNKDPPILPSDFSQAFINRSGGAALAAQPASLLRLPLMSTASFADEVLSITQKRSATLYNDTVCFEELDSLRHLHHPERSGAPLLFSPSNICGSTGEPMSVLETKGSDVDGVLTGIVCRTCMGMFPKQKLLVCSKCRSNITRYCSRECQVKDYPRHKQMCKEDTATLQRLEISSMTSSGRHEISLREGLGAFRKLPWVQEAMADALSAAYQIGTGNSTHTTHVVRLHYAFNFNKKHLADQFTLVSGTLLPHAPMAKILTTFTNKHPAITPSFFSQEYLNRSGGAALAAQPASLLRLPLISTASFADEVISITQKRSATLYNDTVLREDPKTQAILSKLPTSMRPVVVPPPSWDWVGAMRKKLERKGSPVEAALMGGMEAWRDRQRWLEEGVPEAYVDKVSVYITNLRKTYGWEGPDDDDD